MGIKASPNPSKRGELRDFKFEVVGKDKTKLHFGMMSKEQKVEGCDATKFNSSRGVG
jgi:hypothetical protein